MLRLAKFLGFFGLLLGIIFVVVIYPNRDAFLVVFKNGDGLAEGADWAMKAKSIAGIAEFMRENPSYISYLSISSDDSDTLALNENEPRTLGFLSALLVTKALFLEHQSDLDAFLDQPLLIEDLSFYQLPKVYQTSHQNALARFEKDQLIINETQVRTEDAIKGMLGSNDIAIHDFFYKQISDSTWSKLMQEPSLSNTDNPLPFLGIYLSIHPSLANEFSVDDFDVRVQKMYKQFIEDPSFRSNVVKITEKEGKGLKFDQERDQLSQFPQTSASDMYTFYKGIISDTSAIGLRLFQLLQEMNKGSYRDRLFSQYAGVFDNRIGLQNGVDWGITLDGQERIQAVFFDELPVGFWFHLSSDLILQDVQQRMIWDKELHKLLPTP